MVLSSKLEGGANVLTEAIVQHTVVLASRIDGSTGLLGNDYDGYFQVGDTNELRRLMITCEQDTDFYHHLKDQVIARSPLFHPDVERKTWRSLLHSLRMHS